MQDGRVITKGPQQLATRQQARNGWLGRPFLPSLARLFFSQDVRPRECMYEHVCGDPGWRLKGKRDRKGEEKEEEEGANDQRSHGAFPSLSFFFFSLFVFLVFVIAAVNVNVIRL